MFRSPSSVLRLSPIKMAEETKDTKALEAKIAELEQQLAKRQEVETTLLKSNDELQQQLEASEKTVEEVKIIVTHDKKRYEVIVPRVQVAGKVYLAEDLKANKAVVEQLVESGSGVLKAI